MPDSQQQINYGNSANDGTGDPLRTAFIKVDDNFDAIWNAGPVGSNITVLNNTIASVNVNGNIEIVPNGIGMMLVSGTISPALTRSYDLGTTNLRWRNIYANTLTANNITYNGNVFTGNLEGNVLYADSETLLINNVTGAITANSAVLTGNVTAQYFIGDGSLLTGLPEGYANTDAVAYAESGWAGNIVPAVDNTYSLGNATNQWSDLYVSNATIYMNNVPLSLSAGNVLTINGEPVLSNDSNTAITTTGNITANYFIGDGSLLTGLPEQYGNANVAAYLPGYTGNLAPGNILTDNYLYANGAPFVSASTGNITFADTTMSPPDGEDITIGAANSEVRIEAFDIRLDATDDLRLTGNDIVSLRNRSTTDSITIRTDYNNNDYVWEFAVDGTLNTPGDIVVNGDVTGTAGGSTLVIRAEPGSNTALQLNDIVDSEIRTVANLEIRTNVSNTAQVWSFDTDGALTAPGDITTTGNITTGNILTDGYYYANGDPFVSSDYGDSNVVTLLSSFGSNTISTTGNVTAGTFIGNLEITGNVTGTSANVDLIADTYQWRFDNTGNLTLPGNTFAVKYANGTAVALGGSDYGNANVEAYLPTYTGNLTPGNILTDNYLYANGDPFTAGTTYSAGTGIDITGDVISVDANVVLTSGSQNIATTGNISAGNLIGTLATASQTGITAVGTLESLSVNGNVTGGNLITAGVAEITGNATIGNITTTNITGTEANVTITANAFVTTFDTTGLVTFPGAVQLAVYANTTVRDAAITSPAPGMMIYVTGTGMQVRGETQWNTITGSGT